MALGIWCFIMWHQYNHLCFQQSYTCSSVTPAQVLMQSSRQSYPHIFVRDQGQDYLSMNHLMSLSMWLPSAYLSASCFVLDSEICLLQHTVVQELMSLICGTHPAKFLFQSTVFHLSFQELLVISQMGCSISSRTAWKNWETQSSILQAGMVCNQGQSPDSYYVAGSFSDDDLKWESSSFQELACDH